MIIEIDLRGDKELVASLRKMEYRSRNLQPVMADIGEYMKRSIQKNFDAGGRPNKWKPSIRAVEEGGQTLVDTARLKNSMTYQPGRDSVKIGTNVIYAAIQQFGGTIKAKTKKYLQFRVGNQWVKKESVKIPSRPFLLVQEEDWTYIRRSILDFVMEGKR